MVTVMNGTNYPNNNNQASIEDHVIIKQLQFFSDQICIIITTFHKCRLHLKIISASNDSAVVYIQYI